MRRRISLNTTGAMFGLLMLALPAAEAAIVINSASQSYSQNFDTLPASGSAAWTNEVTLSGWNLLIQPSGSSSPTSLAADTGSANGGAFYSYGSSGSTDRALGSLGSGGTYFGSPASGAVAGWIAVSFLNSSGQALNGFDVRYDGEQWRNGGNTTSQLMTLEYGFGPGFASVTSWTAAGAAFDWSSLVNTSTAAAVNGNVAGLDAGVGGTVAALWNAGDTLWLRWTERNDVGNDHGLAIDNFAFTAGTAATPVPLPAAGWLLLAGLGGLGRLARRRRTIAVDAHPTGA